MCSGSQVEWIEHTNSGSSYNPGKKIKRDKGDKKIQMIKKAKQKSAPINREEVL